MPKLTTKKLDFWIQNNLNVLFIGAHGIGKTAIIEETFNRHNLNWRYFSAATMDPWVDFIGVPKEVKDENGDSYLDLIRPAEFRDDTVEMIFFDEFNRAAPKVRNAVMELIQFKSINGRKFKNLRAIWAAINPYDEEQTYDVDQLDPAQQDRFHIIYSLPNKPDVGYFTNKYGTTLATRAVDWWEMLPDEHQELVSPRRLDYALDIYSKGGDLSDVLDRTVRPTSLKRILEKVDSDNESHEDRWLSDGESYMVEISARKSKIDVVEAFSVLQDLSMDQAVSYVHQLPPAHLAKLAQSDKTCWLVLRAIEDNPTDRRKLVTAVGKIKPNDARVTNIIVNHSLICQNTNPQLYNAIKECAKFPAKTLAWSAFEAVVDTLPTSHDDRMLAMISCLDRLPNGTLHRRNKITASVINIIHKLFREEMCDSNPQMFDLVSISPKTIVRVLEAT